MNLPLYPQEKFPGTNGKRDWVNPRANLDAVAKEK
jgi:hypothetical protein